jgi:hypothetical protein
MNTDDTRPHRPVTFADDIVPGREWCDKDAQLWPCEVEQLRARHAALVAHLDAAALWLEHEAEYPGPDPATSMRMLAARLRAALASEEADRG